MKKKYIYCQLRRLVPESARWYIIKGKFEDAYATLQHVADVNGHRVEKDLLMQMIADCNRTEMRSAEVLDQQLYFKIIRDLFGRELRRNTMILYFLWGISASIYYAMTFHSPSFGNDIFSVVFLSGATEVPSYLLAITLIRYLPRRVTIVGCFIATGLFGLSSLLIPNDYVWIIAWTAFACKFFITIAFGLVYILTMEVYPTRHRHLALGTGSACARIGVIIVPSIVDAMSSYSTPILMGMYGGQALLAGFACVWLPETKSIALPETIADTIDYKSLEISLEKQRDAEHRAARLSVEDLDPNDALCESKIFS